MQIFYSFKTYFYQYDISAGLRELQVCIAKLQFISEEIGGCIQKYTLIVSDPFLHTHHSTTTRP